jgi:5-methyltetrahydrofolate--homocysteine methyltransferase
MEKEAELLEKLQDVVTDGDFRVTRELVEESIEEFEIEPRLVAQAVLDGVEVNERECFGNMTFEWQQPAWLTTDSSQAYNSLKLAAEILLPHLQPWLGKKLLIGMAKDEFHHFGMDCVDLSAQLAGFEVVNLGMDVFPEKFLEEAIKERPDIIGISTSFDFGYKPLKKTVELLREEFGDSIKIIIGGSLTHKIGQAWGVDAMGTCTATAVNAMKYLLDVGGYDPEMLGEMIYREP